MNGTTITFGAVCVYGRLHKWFFVDWQIIPDNRSFDICSYSLHLSWNVIPLIILLIFIIFIIYYLVYFFNKKKRRLYK